jgi:hypothetical protein
VIQPSEIYFTVSVENFSLFTVIEVRFHAINECNYSNKLNVGEFGLERDLYTHWDVLAKGTGIPDTTQKLTLLLPNVLGLQIFSC